MSRLVRKGGDEWDLVRKAGGGLNELADVYQVPDGECSELVNFRFRPESWEKRKGCAKKISLSGESKVNSLFVTNFLNLMNYLLAFAGISIYKIDISADEWTATALTVDVTLTNGKKFDVVQDENRIYFVNGANEPLKWLGGTNHVERMGIVAATDGVAAFGGSGSCTAGDHGVRITWINNNAGTESDYHDLSTQTSGGSDKLTISSLTDSTDTQVTHLRIYMTTAGDTGGTYYLAAQVAIGGTYEADISDANLQQQSSMQAVVDDGNAAPPAKARYIAAAKKRLFMGYIYRSSSWRKDEIIWSEEVGLNVTEPEYFPSTNNRKIPTRGAAITRLLLWGDYLYIIHERGICVMTDPSDPANSLIIEIPQTTGCTAPWSVQVGMFQKKVPAPPELRSEEFELVEGIIYKGRWGIMGFDGSREHPLSEKLRPTIEKITDVFEDECVGFFNNGKYYLAYGEKFGKSGEVETAIDVTVDSGNEQIWAFHDSVDMANYPTYSERAAFNFLDQDSRNDGTLKVRVKVFFNAWFEYIGYELLTTVNYKIYFTRDNGNTWELKGSFSQDNADNLRGGAQEIFEHEFVDSGINGVKVEYVSLEPVEAIGTFGNFTGLDRIMLMDVYYEYDMSATMVNNNKILFYDSFENKWARYKGWQAACFAKLDFSGQDGAEFFGESANGNIFRMNIGAEDDGEEIFAHIITGYTDGKFPEVRKRWLRSTLQMNLGDDVVHYKAYVDKLEKCSSVLTRREDGERVNYYGNSDFGEDYYGSNIGESQVAANLDPNRGFRMAEEIWVNSREGLVISGRTVRFVKGE